MLRERIDDALRELGDLGVPGRLKLKDTGQAGTVLGELASLGFRTRFELGNVQEDNQQIRDQLVRLLTAV